MEDNQINAEIAGMILKQYGLLVKMAENGEIGMQKIAAHGSGYYDAVLMDIQMPVMNGYEATRAIRALPRKDAAALPVIAMSANAYDEDVQARLEASMNAHIAKPYQPEALIRLLAEHLK